MRNETTVTVTARPESVWEVLTDVESWPQLTPSMTSVRKLDPGPLRTGMRVRIRQPKLPPALWTVTEFVEGERFVWVAKGMGFRTTAGHDVSTADGSTRLRLTVELSGPLAGIAHRLLDDLTDRYIALEAAGIKGRAEGSA